MPPRKKPIESALSRASRPGIEVALQRVGANRPTDRWLPTANRYESKFNNQFEQDIENSAVNSDDLAEFIAVSGATHCLDAWSYVGKAVHCFLSGDPYKAVHFAYYAELRAAASLLAAEGIGIFKTHHYIVINSGTTVMLPGNVGTHPMAWRVFKWWVSDPRSVNLLKDVIRPGNLPLAQWIEEFNKGQAQVNEIGSEWLQSWGVDLDQFSSDHGARNVASYQPTSLDSWELIPAEDGLLRLAEFWNPLDPNEEGIFGSLDKHLLRSLLESIFERYSGDSPRIVKQQKNYSNQMDLLLRRMGMSPDRTKYWKNFLTWSEEPQELPLIKNAGDHLIIGARSFEIGIISRAVLLLRVATGANYNLLFSAKFDRHALDFWYESIGTERGLWLAGNAPPNFADLWDDIADSLGDLPIFDAESPPDEIQRASYLKKYPGQLKFLEEHERVGIWALGF